MRIFNILIHFGIDKGVPIDTGLDFGEISFLRCFFGSHSFPCRSLLLSTTVLNDINKPKFSVNDKIMVSCFLCIALWFVYIYCTFRGIFKYDNVWHLLLPRVHNREESI